MSTSTQSSNSLSFVLGVIGALASFGVVTLGIQHFGKSNLSAELDEARLAKRTEIAEAQATLLEKYGISTHPTAIFDKVGPEIIARKLGASTVVVPGSPTALKAAAPAPAPAAAPAPSAAPAPAPAAPANPK